jgi:hypothetical protein
VFWRGWRELTTAARALIALNVTMLVLSALLARAETPAPVIAVAAAHVLPSPTEPGEIGNVAQPSGPIPAPPTTAAPAPAPAPAGPVTVTFIGDSIAKTLAQAVAPFGGAYGVNVQDAGILGCGVVEGGPFRYFGRLYQPLPQCQGWDRTWSAAIQANHPDVVAVVAGRWELMDRLYNGRWTSVGDPEFNEYLTWEFTRAIIVAHSTGARVALFTTPYYKRGQGPAENNGLWPEDVPARVDAINNIIRAVAAAHPDFVSLVDFGGRMSPEGRLAITIGGIKVRSDGVHLTRASGAVVAPWMLPELARIVRP